MVVLACEARSFGTYVTPDSEPFRRSCRIVRAPACTSSTRLALNTPPHANQLYTCPPLRHATSVQHIPSRRPIANASLAAMEASTLLDDTCHRDVLR
jgi:hypothetical protein